MSKKKLLICTKGKSCQKLGSKEIFCALADEIEELGLDSEISVKKADCLGFCERGPAMKLKHMKLAYGRVTPYDCRDIIRSLVEESPVERLRLKR